MSAAPVQTAPELPPAYATERVASILADKRWAEKGAQNERTFTLERDGVNVAAMTADFSFASETPVERWFGMEILSVDETACDLTRLNGGGAFLVGHNWDDQVGVVTKAWIDAATKKARCTVLFSESTRGKEIFNDIARGIRRLVSVGYIVRKMQLISTEAGVETHRVTDWQPFEVSVVPVPADPNVGQGRKLSPPTTTTSPHAERALPPMSTAPAPTATVTADFTAERQRIKDINTAAGVLAGRHAAKAPAIATIARACAEEGQTAGEFQLRVLNEVLATTVDASPTRQVSSELGLSRTEQKRYSMLRAISLLANGRPLDGIEREASEMEAKRIGREASGFFVPAEIFAGRRDHAASADAARRDLAATGSAANGGYLVGSTIDTANMVELLRNSSEVIGLGARTITGLVGDVSIPRVLTGATCYWVSENGTITSSAATFGQIAMKPRRIGASVPYSKQFLAQGSIDAESFVRDDVMAAMGVELDRVAINGAGGAEPLGILQLASGDRATSVTFGAAPTWAKVVAFETNVATANAAKLGGNYAYLTTPAVKGAWKTTPKVTNQAVFLWENGDIVNGYAARATNQFPSGDKVIHGNFGQVVYGEWAGIDITIDAITLATTAQVKVTIQKLVDMVIRQGKGFSISTDSGAQ